MAANNIGVKKNLAAYDSGRGPSPAIWEDCPVLEFIEDPSKGIHRFDDFSASPVVAGAVTTVANLGAGYKAFASTSGQPTLLQEQGGGGLVFTETDDNEGCSIQLIQTPLKIIRGGGKLWFEASVKISVVTDTESGFFLGLAETLTLSATVPIAAAGTLADQNFVGFHRLEGDGDQIDTVYKANTVTQVNVQTDVIATTNSAAAALAADTYVKLGMVYDPISYVLSFFVNNIKLSSSKTIPAAAGTDFPNDVNLAPTFALLCASNNDSVATLRWWRWAQALSI